MVALAALLGLVGLVAVPAASVADVQWLCRPGLAHDDCRGDLTTTVQAADGSERVVTTPRSRRSVDCFYVYPTSSQQPTPNAVKRREDSVRAVTRQQAMRFSSLCRTYAPLYRQRTLVALSAERLFTQAQRASFFRLAYADVREAWRSYLRHRNHGRGFVLVGHSQGSRLLRKLVREEIDPRPAVRRRLVSAVLPGADVLVRRGSDRGGDFRHVPLCRRVGQVGCALAWSTFNAPPPDDTRFGRAPLDDSSSPGLDLPHGADLRVACTNPTDLVRNRRRPTHAFVRSEMLPGLLGVLALKLYGGPPPSAATPWLVPAERYTARCVTSNGARVLMVEPVGDARTLSPTPDDTWGLHLLDVNLVLGDVLHLVRRQVRTYVRATHRPARDAAAGRRTAISG